MAINKLTPKQEAFALAYVRCGIAATAYREAYKVGEKTKPETIYPEASRLLARPNIAARVRQLWDEGAEVSLGELVAGYRQGRDIGLEERSSSGVSGAVTGLARLKGFLKDDASKAGDIHIHFDDLLRGVL